jgi:nitrate reductase alpha subunit
MQLSRIRLAEGSEEKRIVFADTQTPPVPVITSRSGPAARPAAAGTLPFTVNLEHLKPWPTLTGRMHFFLDHDRMAWPSSASNCRCSGRRWT